MKILLFLIALSVPVVAFAVSPLGDYDIIHNPWTGRLQAIHSTTTISGGYYSTFCFDSDTCFELDGNDLKLTVHGTLRQTWTTTLLDSLFLLETDDLFLLETGDNLILEP